MRDPRASLVRSVVGVAAVVPVLAALACGSAAATGGEPDDGGIGSVGVVGSGGYGGSDASRNADGSTSGSSADGGPSTSGGPGSDDGDGGAGTGVGLDGSASLDGAGASEGGVGVTFDDPPGALSSLDWTIRGPATYSGMVFIGDASSVEFVVGGVASGDGYTITLSGIDRDGLLCSGVSAPFDVRNGAVVGAGVSIVCPLPMDGATVSVVTIGIGGAGASP